MRLLRSALAVACLVAPPLRAQEAAGSVDAFLDRLVGRWTMTGTVRGDSVTYDLAVTRVLADKYVELHMVDVARPPQYEARVVVGADTVPGRVIAHWMDSFGAAFSVPPGRGEVHGDTLVFDIPYPDGTFRDTFVFDRARGEWSLRIDAESTPGRWTSFASYHVRRSSVAAPAISSAGGSAVSAIASGSFTVTMSPDGETNTADGVALARMSLAKVFEGDLVGTSKGQMLTAITPVKGSAGYVAIERVTGTIGGRRGTFVLQHNGLMEAGAQSLSIAIVPGSGTGELAGIAGELRLTITGGRHLYELVYTLPR